MSKIKSFHPKELKPQEAKYGVRLNYVMFPIHFREIVRALAKNGYQLATFERPIPSPPARIAFSGEIARKGETAVYIDSRSCEIVVIGRSLDETKIAFKQLSEVFNTECGLDLHSNVGYYIINVHYLLDTGKKPLHEIAKVTTDNPYFLSFSNFLDEQMSLFSIRICPKDKIPNQEDWFDISIEPDVLNVDVYHIGVVFRNPDRRKSETFVKSLESIIMKLIQRIEGEK